MKLPIFLEKYYFGVIISNALTPKIIWFDISIVYLKLKFTIIHEWTVPSTVIARGRHQHWRHGRQLIVGQVVLDEGRTASHDHVAGGRRRRGPSQAGPAVAAGTAHDEGGQRGWGDDGALASDERQGGGGDGSRQVDALSSPSGVGEQLKKAIVVISIYFAIVCIVNLLFYCS